MNHKGNLKHGHRHTLAYGRWRAMRQRCLNPNATNFAYYGGAGITICAQWRESFEAFFADMGECPDATMSLDRIDGARGYEPSNCRWATKSVQSANRAMNVSLTNEGRTLLVSEWAREIGVSANMLRQRLRLGWSVHETLTTPTLRRGRQS